MITKYKIFETVTSDFKRLFTYLYEKDIDAIKKYIDNGGVLKMKNQQSVIYFAAVYTNIPILKLLLDTNQFNTSDLDNKEKYNGDTALIYAAKKQMVMSIRLLLEYGANPNIQNYDGFTALMSVKSYRSMRNLAEVSDWSIKSNLGYDVFDILPNWSERLSKDYPEKYKEYVKKKTIKKFKI